MKIWHMYSLLWYNGVPVVWMQTQSNKSPFRTRPRGPPHTCYLFSGASLSSFWCHWHTPEKEPKILGSCEPRHSRTRSASIIHCEHPGGLRMLEASISTASTVTNIREVSLGKVGVWHYHLKEEPKPLPNCQHWSSLECSHHWCYTISLRQGSGELSKQ